MITIKRISGVTVLETEQLIPAGIDKVWKFFSSPLNLQAITPPSMDFRIKGTDIDSESYEGQIIAYTIRPFWWYKVNWITEITHLKEKQFFTDEQRFGPYRFWHHRHFFRSEGNNTFMKDIVTFKVPGGLLGRLIGRLTIEPGVKKIFIYRSSVIERKFLKDI